MTTGHCLTHQQLATWQIATFSEIVSGQYAMAYDSDWVYHGAREVFKVKWGGFDNEK
jgi:hypothetical protein